MNNYEELKCIGNGSFGQVYLVKSKLDGQKYALKTIRMVDIKEKDRKNIENEVSEPLSMAAENCPGLPLRWRS